MFLNLYYTEKFLHINQSEDTFCTVLDSAAEAACTEPIPCLLGVGGGHLCSSLLPPHHRLNLDKSSISLGFNYKMKSLDFQAPSSFISGS